jgi:uncharacterized protein
VSLPELLSRLGNALHGRTDIGFAVLFGSALTRSPDLARDVDVACSFSRPLSLLELGGLEGELEQALGQTVDLVDLDSASTLFRWEVLRTGQLILARDRDAWVTFQVRVQFEWDDLRPYFEREVAGLRRRLHLKG